MKTFGNGKMGFGFSAVVAGQRNSASEPELTVTTTPGGFRLTPAVTRVLGIASGDNVMFINNIANIDAAIASKDDELMSFCEENGIDIETPEGVSAIHAEFDVWGVAKGIQEFDSKGLPKKTTERMSNKQKTAFIELNFEKLLEGARNSDDAELVAAVTREGITEEELKEILMSCVKGDEVDRYMGSKATNLSGITGVGVQVNFTDSNVWNALKSDLGSDANKMNKTYSVDIENLMDVVVFDGHKEVNVKVALLGDFTTSAPIDRSKK